MYSRKNKKLGKSSSLSVHICRVASVGRERSIRVKKKMEKRNEKTTMIIIERIGVFLCFKKKK